MSKDRFPVLIGAIVHNCGALERFTDNTIAALAKDPVLIPEINSRQFSRRIKLLRQLLLQEARFDNEKVHSLCDDLVQIAHRRNDVAHNPIFADDERGTNSRIVVRRKSDPTKVREITEAALEKIRNQTIKTMLDFTRLVPEASVFK